jgi:hypothetical protein
LGRTADKLVVLGWAEVRDQFFVQLHYIFEGTCFIQVVTMEHCRMNLADSLPIFVRASYLLTFKVARDWPSFFS